jgi:hypothetical protein
VYSAKKMEIVAYYQVSRHMPCSLTDRKYPVKMIIHMVASSKVGLLSRSTSAMYLVYIPKDFRKLFHIHHMTIQYVFANTTSYLICMFIHNIHIFIHLNFTPMSLYSYIHPCFTFSIPSIYI